MSHQNERPSPLGGGGRDWVFLAAMLKSPTSTLPHSQNQPCSRHLLIFAPQHCLSPWAP